MGGMGWFSYMKTEVELHFVFVFENHFGYEKLLVMVLFLLFYSFGLFSLLILAIT